MKRIFVTCIPNLHVLNLNSHPQFSINEIGLDEFLAYFYNLAVDDFVIALDLDASLFLSSFKIRHEIAFQKSFEKKMDLFDELFIINPFMLRIYKINYIIPKELAKDL